MPEWMHNRAEHILAKNPSMPKSEAFAIATQQGHALGKNPKGYGTEEGRAKAKAKFDTPEDDVKTPNPGHLVSPKMEKKGYLEKAAFSTNAYSGPMNPTFMKMESQLPEPKIPIALPSRASVNAPGHGFEPTRGGFLMASGMQGQVIQPLRKQAEAEVFAEAEDHKPTPMHRRMERLKQRKGPILNGDHLQYILDKERGDSVDRGKIDIDAMERGQRSRRPDLSEKEKDSEGGDYGFVTYKPGDFKPAKLSSADPVMLAVLKAYDRFMKTAASPVEMLQQAQHVGKTPNSMSNRGSSVREVALPKMLTTIGTIARAPVSAVDKGGKY